MNSYRPSQMQDFANALRRLPRDWAVTPRYRSMSYAEVMADVERSRERAERIGGRGVLLFSQRNISEYSAQVKHLFRHVHAARPDRVPEFSGAPLTVPKSARRSRRRGSIPIEALNAWFQLAATASRPDDRYLPLLGALTGARLGKLVYLRAGGVQELHGQLCLNLIDDEDDTLAADPVERPLKTEVSRRRIVLHEIIRETGFLEWARSLPSDSWLWPRLHRRNAKTEVVRPHGAASKRLIRQMKKVGIHEPYRTVVHSLRHGAKDWHQDSGVDDRTSRMQIGHSFVDVGQSYGSKSLRATEVALLAALPLPEELDLTPYLRRG